MERRNLPRKARDMKRNHSEVTNYESPKVKKKPSKKQYEITTEKKLEVTEFSKRNGNNEDKIPLTNSYDKTPIITEENFLLNKKESTKKIKLIGNKNTDALVTRKKLPSEDKVEVPSKQNYVEISEQNFSLNKKESTKKTKLIDNKNTDAPVIKKKLPSEDKVEVPSKQNYVEISEQNFSLNKKESTKKTKLIDNKNTDAPVTKKKLPSGDKVDVPSKQNYVEISGDDIPALKKKKLSSKFKNEKCVHKESVDGDKKNGNPVSKPKKLTLKKKKEIATVESDNYILSAKRNKKPSKVVIDSGILVTRNKKMSSKKSDQQKTNEKGIQMLQNSVETNYANIDFNINELSNTKICSFNVAGVRAFVKKGGHEYFEKERPDIICLQELKCGTQEELPKEILMKGYHAYWNLQKGHNGVGILSKKLPISFTNGIGDEKLDEESRMVTLEYEKFFLICVYAVNAGRGLTTIDKKMKWNSMFDKYIHGLDKKKSVIIAGDLNCAHEDIDLANPKTNKKSAGFTHEERQGFSNLLSLGFVDTFREFYPKKEGAYTFWTYMGSARSKNVGWRLDYFLVSKRFMTAIKDNVIRSEVLGSDHCPIVLFMIL